MARTAVALAEPAQGVGAGTKVCPRCGMELFSDMDVCYGCLYDFRRDAGRGRARGTDARVDGGAGDSVVGGMSIPLDEPDDEPVPASEVPFPQLPTGTRQAREDGSEAGTPADVTASLAPAPRSGRRYEVERGELSADQLAAAADDDPTLPLPSLPWEEVRLAEAPEGEAGSPLSLRVLAHDLELALPLPEGGLVVGRGRGCDVVVRARAVSRRHVRVTPADGGAVVEDLGATNPAIVRGREVTGRVRIAVGEMVDVCGTRLVLERRAAG